MRGTALLVLAGIAAFAAALRFEAAVHPGAISRRDHAEEFERATRALPALRSLRIHSDDPDLGAKLRRIEVPGGIGAVVEVADVARSLERGSLAAWDAERLALLENRLRAGALPDEFPPVPDARAYFRDERGPFQYEVFLRPDVDLARVRAAVPGATLLGEPVEQAEENSRRRPLAQATIAAVLAAAAASFLLRSRAGRDSQWERRLLAMALPLALLGWSGTGIDVWTIAALVLAGTARRGGALLPCWALLLFPIPALQRMGVVLGLAGIVRLRTGGKPADSPDRGRVWGWLATGAAAATALWFALWPPALALHAAVTEPVATFVAPAERASAAARWSQDTTVVGGESFPDARADLEARRRLTHIFDLAARRAGTTQGEEQASWQRLAAAAARNAVELPRGLRNRRETTDDRAVLWLGKRVGPNQYSYRHYRAESHRDLERGALLAAWLVFALCALLRTSRGGVHWREGIGPLVALAVATAILPRHDLSAALPVFAVAVFSAGWGTPIALACAAFYLPIDFWAAVAAFVMASAAAHPALACAVPRNQ